MNGLRIGGCWMLACLCVSGHAIGQVQRSGGANQQLLSELQQVSSERSALQSENARLKKDLADASTKLTAATKQLAALKAGSASVENALRAARQSSVSTEEALGQLKTRMQELIGRYRELASNLQTVERERTEGQQQLAASRAEFDRCVQRNDQLYSLNGEVLGHYEHQSAFSVLARAEPFTKIERTRNENLIDEYRARADQLRVQKPPAGPEVRSPQ
jgi:chromosome segregation ATPase